MQAAPKNTQVTIITASSGTPMTGRRIVAAAAKMPRMMLSVAKGKGTAKATACSYRAGGE